MAISPNRLVVQPTTERGEAEISCVSITNTIPPNSYVTLDSNGIKTLANQDPQYEGQVKVYVDGSLVQMYVVVDVSGVLSWKLVNITTKVIDSTTGLPFSSL